jgi:hypothetical protein
MYIEYPHNFTIPVNYATDFANFSNHHQELILELK